MDACNIELGSLLMTSRLSGLRLSSSHCARIALSTVSPPESKTIHGIFQEAGNEAFVRAKDAFAISITVSSDTSLRSHMSPDLLQRFVQRVNNAQLWKRLSLEVDSSRVYGNVGDCTTRAVLLLSPSNEHDVCDGRISHKLPVGRVSNYRVPPNVPAFDLVGIGMTFHFSYSSHQTEPRIGNETFMDTEMLLGNCWERGQSNPDGRRRTCVELRCVAHGAHATLQDSLLCTQFMDAFQELLDVAFYSTITAKPAGPSKQITVSSDASFQSFAQFAPAIFTPGCASILSSRSVFLPSLCHTLESVGSTRARSSSLRAKLESIQRSSTQQGKDNPSGEWNTETRRPDSNATAMMGSLWQYMQRTSTSKAGLRRLHFRLANSAETAQTTLNGCEGLGFFSETFDAAKDANAGTATPSPELLLDAKKVHGEHSGGLAKWNWYASSTKSEAHSLRPSQNNVFKAGPYTMLATSSNRGTSPENEMLLQTLSGPISSSGQDSDAWSLTSGSSSSSFDGMLNP